MKTFKTNKRKLLDKLGVDYGFGMKHDHRSRKWKRHYKKYGFDPRETWALSDATAWFMYERLYAYKRDASNVIDLAFHSFTVPLLDDKLDVHYEYINMKDAIDYALEYLEKGIKRHEADFMDDDWLIYVQDAMLIYTEILPALWW